MGRFEDLTAELGVALQFSSRMYWGCCPVHGGDNPSAFNLYRDGEVPGKWICWTRGCEKIFRKTALGFVRGVLTARRFGPDSGKLVPFRDAVEFSCGFLGVPWRGLHVDADEVARQRLRALVGGWSSPDGREIAPDGPARAEVRSRLDIPSPYFLSRGFSPEVLDRFDVGDEGGRAFVPVYSAGRGFPSCVGFTSRSLFDACPACGYFHGPSPCPSSPQDRFHAAKWRHDFASGHHLYACGGQIPQTIRGGDVLLVEGPACLWRLVESGMENAVATFGAKLTDPQQALVEMAGPRRVLVGFDRDEAGEAGFAEVARAMGRLCKVVRVRPPGHDWAASAAGEIRDFLVREGLA